MSLAEFFTLDTSSTPQVFFARDELTDLGDGDVSLKLVAAKRPNRAMAIMHERYKPGADTGDAALNRIGEAAHGTGQGGRAVPHDRLHPSCW